MDEETLQRFETATELFLARFDAFRLGDQELIWHTCSLDSDFYQDYPEPADFRADYGAMLIKGVALEEMAEGTERYAAARALLPVADEDADRRALLAYALVYQTGSHKDYHHELGLFVHQAGRWRFQASFGTPTRRYRPGTTLAPAFIGGMRFHRSQGI